MPLIEFRSVSKTYADGTPAVSALDLRIEDGEFVCILGPSGCGKSTSLRMLAGLETISAGDLFIDGRRVNDEPPRWRDVAMVFENYALYPHLDVFHNIAMPLVARRLGRSAIREQVEQIADLLRLRDHLRQLPRQLSGGQRQRVALGRALVRSPGMFLMDEPLGHLEAYLRSDLRAAIRRMHEMRNATTVYITHDQQEAGAVADRVAVMCAGHLQQVGSMLELIDRPANRFVAQFVGELPINLLPARIIGRSGTLALCVGETELPLEPGQINVAMQTSDADLELGIRPDDVAICDSDHPGTLRGRVAVVEPQGDASFILADTSSGRIGVTVASHAAPRAGSAVGLGLTMARVQLFSPTGLNLFARVARGEEG